jgi:predicted lysophospholipase L1 biosynthesis ABC-type transport system permease subunit
MGTQLLRGRDFDRRDARGVVVVNETMARQFWGSPDAAMGKVFLMDGVDSQVVGVVENGKYGSLYEPPMPFVFAAKPLAKGSGGTLLIETAAPPLAMAGAIRKAVHETDSDALVASLLTLRQSMQLSLFAYRAAAGLIGTIAILGILLAGVGLYGLVSYSVSRRTREIGVRLAMGATPGKVLLLVMREALPRVGIGAAIGFLVALGAARVIRRLLYGVSPIDPAGLVSAVAVVAVIAVLATYIPAHHASQVDPASLLRKE